MSIAMLIAGIMCLVYYVVLVIYNGFGTAFSPFWLVIGIAFIGLYFLSHRQIHMSSPGKKVLVPLYTLMITGILVASIVAVQVMAGMMFRYEGDADYLVILGCQIRDGKPSPVLQDRLDTALDYLEEHPDVTVIVSGGWEKDAQAIEAEVMKQYLVEHGVSELQIMTEWRSVNTTQNLMYTADLINVADSKVVLVTSNFHITRTKMLAERLGYKHIETISAPSDLYLLPNYFVREVFAICFEKLIAVL